jgi:hypothetical protein
MARQVSLRGKPAPCRGQAEFVAQGVDQVGAVGAIEHPETGWQAEGRGMLAQQARADRVEGSGPGQQVARRSVVVAAQQQGGPVGHFVGGAPAEGEQQNPRGVDALGDQMGDSMGQSGGLAGAGARDDQQRGRA